MTDPWVNVRKAITEFKERRGTSDPFKVEGLLSDADALLAMVKYAGHTSTCEMSTKGIRGICDCGFTKAYAALPERLR